jgi:transmembrane sensor
MNTQIYEEASTWLIELRTEAANSAARRGFAAWLSRSPEHVRAYLELTALSEDALQLDADRKIDVDALIAAARAEANVMAMQPGTRTAAQRLGASRRWSRHGLAATVLVGTVAAGIIAWLGLHSHPSYATQLGEQRTIRLEDGSTVELNARSRIRVRYSERQRTVDLLEGQALFRVAQSAGRPFVVASGDARVRAVGTEFDVNRKHSSTVVTVLKGRVAISALPPAGGTRAEGPLLSAGEQVTLSPATVPRPQRANLAVTTAWTQDRLVFESAPLSEVAEEFNRYNPRQLIVEDEGLDDLHISGTFSTSDPTTLPRFLTFLREQPGIRLMESDRKVVVTRK